MFTIAQIDAMTDAALSRAAVKVQDASLEDQKDTNAKFELSLLVQDAELPKQTIALQNQAVALGDIVAALQSQTALALNKKQQAFFDLYNLHLKARKDPAIITSTTGDAIIKDVALDAMMMTQEVWPLFKAAMAAMEVPPGGVDWS